MAKTVETEHIRRVYVDGHYLEVRDWPDAPDYLLLTTGIKENEEYFGEINLSMSSALAKHLGLALLAAAQEKGEEISK